MKYSLTVFLLVGFISFADINPCIASSDRLCHITESNDSTNAVKSIKYFLKWYKNNYKKSSAFRLVGTDKSGHYYVDKQACKKYLKHLKSSGCVSDLYIKEWSTYFVKMDKKFKDNPQNEGPPEGFDYDLISGTQEQELFYNPSKNQTFTIIKMQEYTVIVKSIDIWEHQYSLSKCNGKWKIDGIEILGYPLETNHK